MDVFFFLPQVKREDMPKKISTYTLYLAFVVGAYAFSYTRVGLCLLFLHYVVEAVFHAARLLEYADKQHLSKPLFRQDMEL